MANGIIIIDKPMDWTSMDVCAKLRGIFHERRVGHAGTLDPMATGVLPVFIGRATRAVEFADGEKEYEAVLQLGVVTDTQDVTGTVLEEHPASVAREELETVLSRFRGDILQIPPMYSAVKKGGKKLYELARKGVEVERSPRSITVHGLELLGQCGPGRYTLRVRCSKGTYVRTLCHDIGAALGCGGVMASLRRTEACGFPVRESITLDAVMAEPEPETLLRPVDALFAAYPAVTVEGKNLFRARNGNSFACGAGEGLRRVYGPEGEFLLLGECRGGEMRTVKSFFEV